VDADALNGTATFKLSNLGDETYVFPEDGITMQLPEGFLAFQSQRDLSLARNNELRAILDYNQSVVDFETVQEVPIGAGGGGVTATTVSTLSQPQQ